MSVEQTQAQLEQFKQAFFAEPTDTDTCEALLPKLKVRPLPKWQSKSAPGLTPRACAQLAVAQFPTLHPLRTEDISPQELMLAREPPPPS